MTALAWRLVSVLGSAIILMFFSELFFINEGPAQQVLNGIERGIPPFAELFEFTFYYSLFAYILLIAIARFGVSGLAGLMLAGSLYGWGAEALVIPVAHEAPPISWFWTSASWHPLIDVILGWYFLRLAMRRLSWPMLTLCFAATGLFWGFWATWYWGDSDPGALAPMRFAEFRNYAATTGALWIAGMILADLGARRRFWPGRIEILLVGLVSLGLLITFSLPFLPWSLGLLALVALTLAALGRGPRPDTPRPDASGQDIQTALAPMPHPLRYLLAPTMPLVAVATYGLILETGLPSIADIMVPIILLAGVLSYFLAI